MEITTADPFWLRLWQRSGWSRGLLLAWVGGAAGLAALVGGLAVAAQHEAQVDARANGLGGAATYSLFGHVTAMVLLGALSVTVVVTLVRSGRRVFAGSVLVGVGLGPMTLVATPVRAALVSASFMDTRLWWHVVVGMVIVAVLAGWVWAVGSRLPSSSPETRARSERARAGFPFEGVVLFALFGIGFVVTWNKSLALQESVGVAPSAGWAVLAAGMVMATASRGWRAGAACLALAAGMLVTMYGAYDRDGGWPGVAGWELGGMQSPVVLSASVAALLLLAAPAGATASWVGDRRRGWRIIGNHNAVEGSSAAAAL
jgi:hypothetical protein